MNRQTITHRVFPVALFFGLGSFLGACATTQQVDSQQASSERVDCPGKMICPQTGELICKDQCPLDAKDDVEQVVVLPACCR